MKKMLRRSLGTIVVIGMLCSLILSYWIQIRMIHKDTDEASNVLFWQIEQILDENMVEAKEVEEEFHGMCLRKAKTAAYILQNRISEVNSQSEMEKIARLLEVDELHIFDTEGTIYAGSEPKYFGYNFKSGEQMQFFLPMLSDRTLELCQDVEPNTAEGKMMQYAAVWREDGEGIIQIGMEPDRLLRAVEKNELSYIFTLLMEGDGAALYAADPATGEILGSTDEKLVGRYLKEIGFADGQRIERGKSFHAIIDGRRSYCIFSEVNGVLIGRICAAETLYGKIYNNALVLILCLLAISLFVGVSIFRSLDKHIIRGIANVNSKLQSITDGNLDARVNVCTTPEFELLSSHINQMVESLLDTTDKLSSILNTVQTPIGVYEYSQGMERVRVTEKVPEILDLTDEEKKKLFDNYIWFEKKMAEIRENPVGQADSNIFRLRKDGERYVRLESHIRGNSYFGILMDVTKDMAEKHKIEQERDEDILTGLHNRRGFYVRMEEIFEKKDELKHAALVMIDTDKLKWVNDTFGHDMGDCYLRGMAEVLRTCTAQNQLTARLSGDEFSIFLYGCETREELESYIAELEEKQDGYDIMCQNGNRLKVRYSLGSAFYQEDGEEFRALLKCADDRMYENKRRKKQKESESSM